MQVRRFSPDLKHKLPGGHPGLYIVPIQLDSTHLFTQNLDELAERVNGLPILLNIGWRATTPNFFCSFGR